MEKQKHNPCIHEEDLEELFRRSDRKQDSLNRIERTLETKELTNGFTKKETERDIDELEDKTKTLYSMVNSIEKSQAKIEGKLDAYFDKKSHQFSKNEIKYAIIGIIIMAIVAFLSFPSLNGAHVPIWLVPILKALGMYGPP